MNQPLAELDFVRLLGRRGSIVLHAAALRDGVLRDQRGVLVIGPTRSGKSTVATAALVSGREVLADDSVVLAHRETGPEVVAVRGYLQLRGPTVDLLSDVFRRGLRCIELEDGPRWHLEHKKRDASGKGSIHPHEIWFVSVDPTLAHCAVQTLDQATALSLTIASTFGMGHEDGLRDMAPRLMPLLQLLVESCRTFRVRLGSALMTEPAGELERLLELTSGSADAQR